MPRFLAGVYLSDRVACNEVANRCGVKPLLQVLRERRLRWFGHVKRRRGAGVLGEVMEMDRSDWIENQRQTKECLDEDY